MLTDAQLRQGVELMFFAYRDMISDADKVLESRGYGRAHHRCLHFVWRRPGMSVTDLLETLAVTKQSLNRVLRQLVEDGLILSAVGAADRRQHERAAPRGGHTPVARRMMDVEREERKKKNRERTMKNRAKKRAAYLAALEVKGLTNRKALLFLSWAPM